jgi:hypothetical protein
MKHNHFTEVSFFFTQSHSTLTRLSHLGKGFTIVMEEIRPLITVQMTNLLYTLCHVLLLTFLITVFTFICGPIAPDRWSHP